MFAMDNYDPNRSPDESETSQHEIIETQPPIEKPELPAPSHFPKDLVKFAAYFTGLLTPVLLGLETLSGGLQLVLVGATETLSENPEQPTISKGLAQGLVVFAYTASFAVFWFGKNFIQSQKAVKRLWDYISTMHQQYQQSASEDAPTDDDKDQQIKRISQQLEQQRLLMKKIQSQMYDDHVRARHDFVSFKATYVIGPGGDIEVRKEVILLAPELDVHFWRFYVNGEDMAVPLEDLSCMFLEVKALDDDETKVIPLVLEDRPTRKIFTANFLPAISPNQQRAFSVHYRWPGFFNELLERGSTRYYWDSHAYTTGAKADFWTEWRFDGSYGNVNCDITGANPNGLTLTSEKEADVLVWRYGGDQISFGNMHLELHFNRE